MESVAGDSNSTTDAIEHEHSRMAPNSQDVAYQEYSVQDVGQASLSVLYRGGYEVSEREVRDDAVLALPRLDIGSHQDELETWQVIDDVCVAATFAIQCLLKCTYTASSDS